MFIRNAKNHTVNFKYRVNGQAKRIDILANTIVEFPTITSVNEIIFPPLEAMQRQINASLGRNITTGMEYRMTAGLTGATL